MLDKIFFKVCVADERMLAVIALVCKKWILFINEKFVERVHYAWLDREYDAQSWTKELKEKFRKPLNIENCFHCNRRYKVEKGYYRTPTGCSVIQSDLNAGSIYCYFCALQFDNRCGWESKCSCFFLLFNSAFSIRKHTDYQSSIYLINELTYGCVFFQDFHCRL